MSGVRVIDVGTFLAGHYAASILGEFGAEILKVEHPIAGDKMHRADDYLRDACRKITSGFSDEQWRK